MFFFDLIYAAMFQDVIHDRILHKQDFTFTDSITLTPTPYRTANYTKTNSFTPTVPITTFNWFPLNPMPHAQATYLKYLLFIGIPCFVILVAGGVVFYHRHKITKCCCRLRTKYMGQQEPVNDPYTSEA